MASTDNRLEKLESELAEQRAKTAKLEAEIAGLRGGRQATPNPPPEEGVKIISPRPSNREFVMPSGVELARLHELVCTRFSSLRPQPRMSGNMSRVSPIAFARWATSGAPKLYIPSTI
jgi:hypothetical protein